LHSSCLNVGYLSVNSPELFSVSARASSLWSSTSAEPSSATTPARTHPTFVGPMFLHWDGHYSTYVDFFTELRTSLDSAVSSTEVRLSSSVVIGTDEEKGLTKAVRDVFRESTHLCVHTRAALSASRRARPPHVCLRTAPAASVGQSSVEQQRCRVNQPPAESVNRVASTASARTC